MQTKEELTKTIMIATGKEKADLKITNCKVVDVFSKEIFESDVLVSGKTIAGFGGKDWPEAKKTIDAKGAYLVPGLINTHLHIESSLCSPDEYARLVVPCGTTTSIADPHEICNVCGLEGFDYMLKASEDIGMDVFFMFPSCVPATRFEHSGAILDAKDVESRLSHPRVLGLGEMMNFPGVCFADSQVLDKLIVTNQMGKHIDGHAPSIQDSNLDAYCDPLIVNDHECETPSEILQKIRRGMYIMLREGSAGKNLLTCIKALNNNNSSRFLFCTDDRETESILEEGDIDNNVRLAIKSGLDPLTAIQIATINGALASRLYDRGAIAPGYQADFLLVDDLETFIPKMVFTSGRLVAENGKFLYEGKKVDSHSLSKKLEISNLSLDSFALKLTSDKVRCIQIIAGSLVTNEYITTVKRDSEGYYVNDPDSDICKISVIERHHGTGFMSTALLNNFGLKNGAIGTTIAHDSHNLIIVGDNDEDMKVVADELIKEGGGIAIAQNGKILDSLPLEIGGLMTAKPATEVNKILTRMEKITFEKLSVNKNIEPFMLLSFMALPVIPKLKLTDSGLFDEGKFDFVNINID